MSTLPHAIEWQFQRLDATSEEAYLVEVIVRYDIEPYVPARLSGPPEDCYPAEGGCVIDMVAFNAANEVVELTDEERKEVSDWVEQHHDHNADQYGDPDRAYEEMRDDRMDRNDWAEEAF